MDSIPGHVRLAQLALRNLLRLPAPLLGRLGGLAAHAAGMDAQARAALVVGGLVQRATARGATDPRAIAAARREMALAAALLAPPSAPGVAVQAGSLATAQGAIATRVCRPASASASAPALVYYHGGGFVLGSLETHDAVCRQLASRAGVVVVSVAYRLAPEHPFPAGRDDAIAAFRAVARDAARLGLDRARLAVGGDSAGGNLAALVALATREDACRPAAQLLLYPATDLTRASPSIARFARGFFLERATLDWFAELYIPDPMLQADASASPAFADVRGAPPAIVVTAGFDPLVDEGRAYAERLVRAAVPTEHLAYPTLFHGFAQTSGAIAAADAALGEIAGALADRLRR